MSTNNTGQKIMQLSFLKMVCSVGYNDMGRGWRVDTDENKRVYQLWKGILTRCYDPQYHKRYPTYRKVEVCERWKVLSNFVEDIVQIEGYQEWLTGNTTMHLDKDIKGKGRKLYSPETCIFVTAETNLKEMHDRRGTRRPVVAEHILTGDIIDFPSINATKEAGFNHLHVYSKCCYPLQNKYKGYRWFFLEDFIEINKLDSEG